MICFSRGRAGVLRNAAVRRRRTYRVVRDFLPDVPHRNVLSGGGFCADELIVIVEPALLASSLAASKVDDHRTQPCLTVGIGQKARNADELPGGLIRIKRFSILAAVCNHLVCEGLLLVRLLR